MRTLLAVVSLVLLPVSASAHQMFAKAKVVGDQLKVEAYHDDDTPAQNARVEVKLDDQLVIEGKTDERGLWSAPAPKAVGSYKVRVSGDGHVARATFEVGTATAEPSVQARRDGEAESLDIAERRENTRLKWDRLGVGLGLVLGCGGMWFFLRRKPDNKPKPTESTESTE